jgi:hypothetical protein
MRSAGGRRAKRTKRVQKIKRSEDVIDRSTTGTCTECPESPVSLNRWKGSRKIRRELRASGGSLPLYREGARLSVPGEATIAPAPQVQRVARRTRMSPRGTLVSYRRTSLPSIDDASAIACHMATRSARISSLRNADTRERSCEQNRDYHSHFAPPLDTRNGDKAASRRKSTHYSNFSHDELNAA